MPPISCLWVIDYLMEVGPTQVGAMGPVPVSWRQIDHWQSELLNPRTRFNNWSALMDARLTLHQLDEVCEDQRAAIQDWIEALKTWPEANTPARQREHHTEARHDPG